MVNNNSKYETLYQSCEVATLFLWLGGLFFVLSRQIELSDTNFMLWASGMSILAISRMAACRVAIWKKRYDELNPFIQICTVLMWVLACLIPIFPAKPGSYSNEVFYLFLLLSSISASVIFYPVQWMVIVKNFLVCGSLSYLLYSQLRLSSQVPVETIFIKAGLLPILFIFNLRLSRCFYDASTKGAALIANLESENDAMSDKAKDFEAESYFKEYLVEATEAASKAKSVFLANISHEIRTPLNAVIGFSQVLEEEEEMPEIHQENLRRISLNAQHLLVLINDVLDMSKIEAGKLELETEVVDLHKLLNNIVEFLISRADDKGIQLLVEIDESVPRVTELDPLKLRQVLINLLNNAIKFTDEGKVVLYAREGHEKGLIEFGVSDTGVGIAPDEQDRLFREFEQLTNSRGLEGTGLGLTISSRIVNLMQGKIEVKSVLGKGSSFFFSVPVVALEDEALLADVKNKRVSTVVLKQGDENNIDQFSLKNARVLIADDIQSNRLLLKTALKSLDLTFFEAVDGVEAVEMWKQHGPDLILMDRRMPKMDGVAATEFIREHARMNGLPIPLIYAVTADVIGKDAADNWEGIDGFIPKPFDIREVKQIVASSLGQLGEETLVLPS